MYTIGTAGHVDHGKSTLVKALTGIDPDRLPEEKQREMTIDLGFARLILPDGQVVGVVDVPGHERFIKNMLAGVGGIDLALLVVAADEGVMPQTREHLAILDLLDVKHGLVALTKQDRVEQDWLELVIDDLTATLKGSVLEGARLLPVSSITGEGLPELRQAIAEALTAVPPKLDRGQPRLPVDRAFTLTGFGTVVTGTLIDGSFDVGDRVELLPGQLASRIRGIQMHNKKVEHVPPGSRTALNLAGVTWQDVRRGTVVALPGQLVPAQVVDAKLRLVSGIPHGLGNKDQVDIFTGTSETLAQVTLLDSAELQPGDQGWVRLRLLRPLAVARHDKFILRLPSPSVTIGGGEIIETAPRLHRRFRSQTLAWLASIEAGSPDEIMLQALPGDQPVERRSALQKSGLGEAQAQEVLDRLLQTGQAMALDSQVISQTAWRSLTTRVRRQLADYHQRLPLRPGMPKEELKGRVGLQSRVFSAALQLWIDTGVIVDRGGLVADADFAVELPADLRRRLDQAIALVRKTPYSPPAETELRLSEEELGFLIREKKLTRVADGMVFDATIYQEMLEKTVDHIGRTGKMTVGEFRDMFNTTRKYTLAFFDHLDSRQVTRRVGDDRVLGPAANRKQASS